MLVFYTLGVEETFALFDVSSSFSSSAPVWTHIDLFLCVVMGVCCGLVAVLFVIVVDRLSAYRNVFLAKDNTWEVLGLRKLLIVFIVLGVIAPLNYVEVSFGLDTGTRTITNNLFAEEVMYSWIFLLVYLPYKLAVTALSVCLPLPVGLFSPVFLCGGTDPVKLILTLY